MSDRIGVPRVWRLAQGVSVVGAVAVVGLLLVRPEWGLYVTWYVLIPLVPALLLLAPRLWRNLCPIAVVHQLPRMVGRGGSRRLPEGAHFWAPSVAGLGLFLIVPLRHPILNEHGPALAAFVLGVLGVAVLGGLVLAGKSGWCSTFCPVVPVERLYGQQPVAEPPHAHCAECVRCTRPCFDREGTPAVAGLLGEGPAPPPKAPRRGPGGRVPLLRSPTGLFGAAFPGFVLGYFTAPEAASIGGIYFHVLFLAALSLVVFAGLQPIFRFSSLAGLAGAGALAAGLYYWFTVPAVIAATQQTLGVGPVPGWVEVLARGAFLALVVVWLVTVPGRRRRAFSLPEARTRAGAPA